MTSTLLQPQQHSTNSPTNTNSTTNANMTWSNDDDKLRFSCIDNISLKQLWKLIVLDSSSSSTSSKSNHHHQQQNVLDSYKKQQQKHETSKHNKYQRKIHHKQLLSENSSNEKLESQNAEYFTDCITNREILTPSRMSLLQFFAINALELSAPATPVLLQQNQTQQNNLCEIRPPHGWMQLSGHPESIVPTQAGIVRKRISCLNDCEVQAYTQISQESQTAQIVPHFYGTLQLENECFIELQDLLAGFKDPCVMDIKMGCRTFLESEVTNKTLRKDLYEKMIAVDPYAPTAEEHASQAITKLRYMLFRETMSSSHTKGFRIEAIRLRGRPPVKDLKMVRTNEQIQQTIEQFLCARKNVQRELIKRLKHMRSVMENSHFFQTHEIVGSSIFIVYDDNNVGAWLIDFAKSRVLPVDKKVTHRAPWSPGNREEGLLKGMDELIIAFEHAHNQHITGHKCLQP